MDANFSKNMVFYIALCAGLFAVAIVCSVAYLVFLQYRENHSKDPAPKLASYLYKGSVYHARMKVDGVSPTANRFTYPIQLLYIDLSEIDKIFRNRWFWSAEKPNLVSFHSEDYLSGQDVSLDLQVRNLVEKDTGVRPGGPIRMLTNVRYFGYCFNPVSIYYCFSQDETSLEAVILDVTNTPWLEKHPYVLNFFGDQTFKSSIVNGKPRSWRYRFPKKFHVSPFMNMQHDYDWELWLPGPSLQVRAQSWKAKDEGETMARRVFDVHEDASDKRTFDVGMTLKRHELSAVELALALLEQPLMTFIVQLWIHWQAVIILWKGVDFVPHPDGTPVHLYPHGIKHLWLFTVAGIGSMFSLPLRLVALLLKTAIRNI